MPEREPFVFQKYFNNVKYADAFLKIQEPYTVLPIHRIVLATKSSYFETFFDRTPVSMETHYSSTLPTVLWNGPFSPCQMELIVGVIEWIYNGRVLSLNNESCWHALGLVGILGLQDLENIIFKFVAQRVSECADHFPEETWIWYLGSTAYHRPDFLSNVLETAFMDLLGPIDHKDAMKRYGLAKNVVSYQLSHGKPLKENQIKLLMDTIGFENIRNFDKKEHIVPSTFSTTIISQSAPNKSSQKEDSAVELKMDQVQLVESGLEHPPQKLEEVRQHFERTIGKRPSVILSPATITDSQATSIAESVRKDVEASLAAAQQLSTEDVLKAVGQKLETLQEDRKQSRNSTASLSHEAKQKNSFSETHPSKSLPVSIPISQQRYEKPPESLVNSQPILRNTAPLKTVSRVVPLPPQRKGFFNILDRKNRSKDLSLLRKDALPVFNTPERHRKDVHPSVTVRESEPAQKVHTMAAVVPIPFSLESDGRWTAQQSFRPLPHQRSHTLQPQTQNSFSNDTGTMNLSQSPPWNGPSRQSFALPGNIAPVAESYQGELRPSHSMYDLNGDYFGDPESLSLPQDQTRKPSGFLEMIKGFF